LDSWVWSLISNEWILEGLLENISSAVNAMDVSPYDPLVAVGTQNGCIQVFFDLNFLLSGVEHDSFWIRI
jgi:hypothetical protein